MLRLDHVDVAVVETHDSVPGEIFDGLDVQPMLVDPFRLVLPSGHPLTGRQPIQDYHHECTRRPEDLACPNVVIAILVAALLVSISSA